MEDWQKLVITKNLPELIKLTSCSRTLLATLLAHSIISDEEKQEIDATSTQISQADKLYKILTTRTNAYQVLLKVCIAENQSGVVRILKEGEYERKLAEALIDCNVTEFVCRCFISTSDFQSIQKAIANYSEITQFKIAFEQDASNKPWLLRGPKNETLLHIATAYGYIKLMKYLVRLGVDVNDVDIEGRTAGHYLGKISTNIIESTKVLMSNGLNIHQADKNGMTAASTMATYSNITKFHYYHWVNHIMSNRNEQVFAPKSKTGATQIHHAIESLDLEKGTLKLVHDLDNQDINLRDKSGRTILHSALLFGRSLKTIKNLISLGADYTIVSYAKEGVLHFAVQGGNKKVLTYLISLQLDIHVVDELGETPLHKVRFTKTREYFGLTKFLLDNGLDLYAQDTNGNNIAHLFALTENISIDDFQAWIKSMIDCGFTNIFFVHDHFGKTPLQIAMERFNLDLSEIMLIDTSSIDDDKQLLDNLSPSIVPEDPPPPSTDDDVILENQEKSFTGEPQNHFSRSNSMDKDTSENPGFEKDQSPETNWKHSSNFKSICKFFQDLSNGQQQNSVEFHRKSNIDETSSIGNATASVPNFENGETENNQQDPENDICLPENSDDCWSAALKECNVSYYKPKAKDFVLLCDFENLNQAIEHYVDIESFKIFFEKHQTSKPWLLRGPKNETLFHIAASYGYISLIYCLIEVGLSINDVDDDGKTPALYVGKKSTNIIKTTDALSNCGLNICHVDDDGVTMATTLAINEHINRIHYHLWAEYIFKMGCRRLFEQKSNIGTTALHDIVEFLDLERSTIELILKSAKINVNHVDNQGQISLHWALKFGRSLETVQELIVQGADYKLKDNKKESVLHFAVRGSNQEVISFICSLTSNFNEIDKLGETPLHKVRFTKSRDYLGMTKFLLDNGANLFAKDKDGNNIAHLFALANNISSDDFQIWVKGMVDNGHGSIFNGQFHRTPLHFAIERLDLDLDTINLLLDSSWVDINGPDNNGHTLLHLALRFGRSLQTIKNLICLGAKIKKSDKTGPLHLAIIGGNIDVIKYLISEGVNVYEKDTFGDTPLHDIILTRKKNYFDITKVLLDNGADLYCEKVHCRTVAHEMARSKLVTSENFKSWVKAMIEIGHVPLFTVRCEFGKTPLHYAIMRLNLDLETVKLLIESTKLDINQPDSSGDTLLHLALRNGRDLETIKNLVYLAADWKRTGEYDRSVMHYAVTRSNEEAFVYFKSLGADSNAKDMYGRTPLHEVLCIGRKNYLDMAKLLLSNGASLDAKDIYGVTANQYMESYYK